MSLRVRHLHPFDLPPRDAIRLQSWLAAKVVARGTVRRPMRRVAGVHCAASPDGHVHGVVVVCEAPDWHVVETVSASAPAPLPSLPGLLSFRETPILLDALARLRTRPDLLLVHGHGVAHPRGLGLAAHLGLHLDVPVVGVATSRLVGTHEKAGRHRGDWRALMFEGRRVGLVLTTRNDTNPLYVSVGHHVGLFPAARRVLECATRYRLPEPLRHADALSRQLARGEALATRG